MKMLMSKLYDMENEKREMEERARRGLQVGTGGRSEKIRTYNWKDSRCSDHRIGQNYPLSQFLNGDIDPMISQMIAKDQEEKLKEIIAQTAAVQIRSRPVEIQTNRFPEKSVPSFKQPGYALAWK